MALDVFQYDVFSTVLLQLNIYLDIFRGIFILNTDIDAHIPTPKNTFLYINIFFSMLCFLNLRLRKSYFLNHEKLVPYRNLIYKMAISTEHVNMEPLFVQLMLHPKDPGYATSQGFPNSIKGLGEEIPSSSEGKWNFLSDDGKQRRSEFNLPNLF